MNRLIKRGLAALGLGLLLAVGLPAPVLIASLPPGLQDWNADRIDGRALPDPGHLAPGRIADFFAGLSAGQRDRLVALHPATVGNMDGAPIALRYRANALCAPASHAGRQLLLYAPTRGLVAEVFGDVATARRIAVLVPGADTAFDNFDAGYDNVAHRSPAWQARQLSATAAGDVAVIAWLGYRPPKGMSREVIRSEVAESGAGALVRFLEGLVAQCPQATIALVGHSYGSVLLGHAAVRLPTQATDLVAIGSPGMDVSRAAQLHTTARVWAGSGPDDWTRFLPDARILGAGHGTRPTSPGYGAHILNVRDAIGHDGYFVPGTAALNSIAGVVNAIPERH